MKKKYPYKSYNNKKSVILALVLLFIFFNLVSQTGPGGVGASANNIIWLDANRGITAASSSVTNWADQSGNAFNAVPSSTNARPLLASNSVNGYPSLDFDGTDDELWVSHDVKLNLTQWHFFVVPKVKVHKNYNAWLVKGNDGQENYEILSYNTGNIHVPIYFTDASRTAPSSAGAQVNTTDFEIIEYSYISSSGRRVYKNYGSIYTDADSKTPAANSFSLYIGNEKNISGRFINGNMAEVIMYNAPLNSAQRIIVNNYLAAKYNRTLTSNDLYDEDDAASGNYDHEVAGIGRIDASNLHSDAQGSGIVRILNPSGMDDNEFYIWGHDNAVLGSYQTADFPASEGLQGRLVRVWRGSETGSITSFDVRFDLTGLGPVTASHLRLLIDTDNDGVFSDETAGGGGVISGATLVGGNVYEFTNVTGLNNNIRFTLGTTNIAATPLPVEFLNFNAIAQDKKVLLSWATATEKNNDYFTIEKTQDANKFETVAIVKSAGNTNFIMEYSDTDYSPYQGISYYRLKQTDYNGQSTYSSLIPVNYLFAPGAGLSIFPNPNNGNFTVDISGFAGQEVLVVLKDVLGKEVFSKVILQKEGSTITAIDLEHKLSAGEYFVIASSRNELYSQKIIVK